MLSGSWLGAAVTVPHAEMDSWQSVGFVSRAVELCKANGEHVTDWRRHLFEKFTVAQLLTGPSSRRLGFDSRTIIFQKVIIIIFINCNLVVTRWQWLFYMYTNMEKK